MKNADKSKKAKPKKAMVFDMLLMLIYFTMLITSIYVWFSDLVIGTKIKLLQET